MVATTTLGGSAKNVKVAKSLIIAAPAWRHDALPDEQTFEAIKGGIDAVSSTGALAFLNSGDFYGPPDNFTENLALLARFFKKYPEYADKTFLSVKSGFSPKEMRVDASEENLRHSIKVISDILSGTKKIDLFQCARVDPAIGIEETMKTLSTLQKEGKFSHIGISEVRADTLRRANAITPISAVEIEVSPWSYEDETKKVIATAQELDIAVIAYAPLGSGFLTGKISKPSDMAEGDLRRYGPRFQPEVFDQNFALVKALKAIAQRKNVTLAQLSIAWVSALGRHIIPLPGASNIKQALENLGGGDVILNEHDLREIGVVMDTIEVLGQRYPSFIPTWG